MDHHAGWCGPRLYLHSATTQLAAGSLARWHAGRDQAVAAVTAVVAASVGKHTRRFTAYVAAPSPPDGTSYARVLSPCRCQEGPSVRFQSCSDERQMAGAQQYASARKLDPRRHARGGPPTRRRARRHTDTQTHTHGQTHHADAHPHDTYTNLAVSCRRPRSVAASGLRYRRRSSHGSHCPGSVRGALG
jgi:hypothetical protein